MASEKQTFCVTGFVELGVGAQIKAKTPRDALLFAVRNRGGVQDINWEDRNWESDVNDIKIVDCTTGEVLASEAELPPSLRWKKHFKPVV